ncbi:N-acetylmuramoyl-L-alanine amidase [Niveispirillum sp. SYP-B3756]|uniref:peptidoglycan recognition protein family protein n=1 Tax=Niveispirillum sp. SYP-B3756 TaxID=2662178 RepID=UPI0012928BA0|nr:peptidoglycan recognition family protein [Niveispirillum sp. SYP-B3756]MQP64627.1 N-acetylmuramoyl-L-alanine amidase [Niveispirillum sp. SYP-B3756]
MLLDGEGWAVDPKVTKQPYFNLRQGEMTAINGIVVHQTASPTLQSTLNSYQSANPNGAHFLIDKDGTLYQTASIRWLLWHVGKLRSRCLVRKVCTPKELKALNPGTWNPSGVHKIESRKKFPDRFPMNADSIGIEIVGNVIDESKDAVFETVTVAQNRSLQWLVAELCRLLSIPAAEIYRHPEISYKKPHEAETAQW